MDKSSLFSALSLVSVFVYIYVGIYIFKQNTKSLIHRWFLLLCTSYAIWSFAYAFAYVSNDQFIFIVWNKISAIGWCSFTAITLYLVLLITENRIIKKRIVRLMIFTPAVLFLYMTVFLFGYGIKTPTIISNIFYIGDFLYNFIFLIISIIILFAWGLKSDSKRIKKQSNILVVTSIIPFLLNLMTQTIAPLLGFGKFPQLGQLYAIIMIMGVYMVITKYKFLRLPEKFLFEEIEDKMMDMVLFLNEKNQIIRISKHTLNLLGFEEYEILNKDIRYLFNESVKTKIDNGCIKEEEEKKYNDIEILKKDGTNIPTNITFTPIFDNRIHDFLGSVLVMQDISIEYELRRKNEQLHERAIKDSLTKLYNHQYSVEIIIKEINNFNAAVDKKGLCLMMLDIDYFKNVNDNYGHLFGDQVLETVSNLLLENVNDRGYVGRFGGEEFIIILPQTGIDKAYEIGEKIRNGIEKYKFDKGLKLTLSIGIKQFKDESSVQLVKNADDLLYKAKENGRNRIEYN